MSRHRRVLSRSIKLAGPQLRQAAAAARQKLLKPASARPGASPSQLAVADASGIERDLFSPCDRDDSHDFCLTGLAAARIVVAESK